MESGFVITAVLHTDVVDFQACRTVAPRFVVRPVHRHRNFFDRTRATGEAAAVDRVIVLIEQDTIIVLGHG
jgi:hypothetical protein